MSKRWLLLIVVVSAAWGGCSDAPGSGERSSVVDSDDTASSDGEQSRTSAPTEEEVLAAIRADADAWAAAEIPYEIRQLDFQSNCAEGDASCEVALSDSALVVGIKDPFELWADELPSDFSLEEPPPELDLSIVLYGPIDFIAAATGESLDGLSERAGRVIVVYNDAFRTVVDIPVEVLTQMVEGSQSAEWVLAHPEVLLTVAG